MSSKKPAERKKRKKMDDRQQKVQKRYENSIVEHKEKSLAFREEKERMGRLNPIRNQQQPKQNNADEILDKLSHNIEILKALEEEYDVFQEDRVQRNKELEAAGFDDLDSKIKHLQEKASSNQVKDEVTIACEEETIQPRVRSEDEPQWTYEDVGTLASVHNIDENERLSYL